MTKKTFITKTTRRFSPKAKAPPGLIQGAFRVAVAKWPWVFSVLLVSGIGFGLWVFVPYWQVLGQFSDSVAVPSRVYERPPRLVRGQRLSSRELERLLAGRGYRSLSEGPEMAEAALKVGEYRRSRGRVSVHLRSFPTQSGWTVPLEVDFRFRGARLAELELLRSSGDGGDGVLEGQRIEAAWLDPLLIRSYFGQEGGDRWPLRVEELPDHVVNAILAAEDRRFFDHRGVSIRGIVRAFLSNLKGEGNMQGGSTLTQQLVKNLYLTHDRVMSRKVREAFLAVYLELRYEKTEILQAYLNEIYLGRRSGANLLGIGAASRAFFGVPPEELDLAQAATVAGMIQSPANFTPDRHQEGATRRRNWVLDRMLALGWITPEHTELAKAAEMSTREARASLGARYAADAILEELRGRYELEPLARSGYVVLSTLDSEEQRAAQKALRGGLEKLDASVRKSGTQSLQGALVAADPRDGAIRAWVGGRDYGASQFDRVRQARRQVGSAFKPVILAAAFAERAAKPSDRITDEPLTLDLDGKLWTPSNADNQFHGEVSVRETVERSLNIPTVKLALAVGLERVVAWGKRMGVTSPLRPLPSLALGAFEMTPLELLGVYSTLANEGRRPSLHLVEGVLDRRGEPVAGEAVPIPELVLERGVAHLVTSILEGVVERGTGRGVRASGYQGAVAAKTGTTNERRDAWFAGYTPSSVGVVWVGYDEPARTGLSGTSGALPIFADFLGAVIPAGGYGIFRQPPEVTTRTIDPETGALATERCYNYIVETYLADDVPEELCWLHDDARGQRRQGFWRRMFKRRGDSV